MSIYKAQVGQAYRPDIDGLRAIAVTAVVLFHAGVEVLSGGFVGVDVFFVLSGYLITGHIYLEVVAGRFTYGAFYGRRFKRILPALLIVILVCSICAVLILSPKELMRYSISAASAVFGFSNFYFWWSTNYFSPSADRLPMLMTWSLAVEEQFYVFFPVLLLLLFRYMRRNILLAVTLISMTSLLLATISIRLYPSLTFYMLPMRAWELGAGAVLAIAEAQGFSMERYGRALREALAAIGTALILLPIFLYSGSTNFPGEAAIPPVLGTVMIIAVRRSLANRMLGIGPAVFVGRISYSWYLWHWPLLAFQRVASPDFVPHGSLLVNACISFMLAVCSYYLVEQPFRKTTLRNSQVLRWYGAAAVCVAAIVVAPVLLRGLPWRVDGAINAMEASIAKREPCLVQYGASAPIVSTKCAPQNNSKEAIALIGDSHAAALAPGLREVAEKVGYSVVVLTKSSCPPMVSVTRFMPNHPGHDRECALFNKAVFDYLQTRSDVRTVVLAGYWAAPLIEAESGSRYVDVAQPETNAASTSNSHFLRRGLTDQIEAMTSSGRNVVLLQDVPLFDKDPVSIALRNALPARTFLADLSGDGSDEQARLPASGRFNVELQSARSVVSDVAGLQIPGVTIVDPYASFCDQEKCAHRVGGDVLYVDSQHLSVAGSSMLAAEILRSVTAGKVVAVSK